MIPTEEEKKKKRRSRKEEKKKKKKAKTDSWTEFIRTETRQSTNMKLPVSASRRQLRKPPHCAVCRRAVPHASRTDEDGAPFFGKVALICW
jgi:hypothetical protein